MNTILIFRDTDITKYFMKAETAFYENKLLTP